MKCLEEKLLMQEKFVDSSGLPPPVDLYFTVLGVGFSGATILGIKVFGDELRSRSSFNWLRRFWLVEDEEFGCDEAEARINKGEVGTGKGFSLQQTESDESYASQGVYKNKSKYNKTLITNCKNYTRQTQKITKNIFLIYSLSI